MLNLCVFVCVCVGKPIAPPPPKRLSFCSESGHQTRGAADWEAPNGAFGKTGGEGRLETVKGASFKNDTQSRAKLTEGRGVTHASNGSGMPWVQKKQNKTKQNTLIHSFVATCNILFLWGWHTQDSSQFKYKESIKKSLHGCPWGRLADGGKRERETERELSQTPKGAKTLFKECADAPESSLSLLGRFNSAEGGEAG